MRYIQQFLIILIISFIGEGLSYFIPLPIPGSIYGIVILFTSLLTGLIKLEQVREAGKFLIEIMILAFIGPGVGLMETWGIISGSLPQYLITIIGSTFIVMAVAGKVTQAFMKRRK